MLLAVCIAIAQAPPLDREGLARRGWHERALVACDAEILARPGDTALRDQRGDLRLFQGQFAVAVEDFDAHLARHPQDGPRHWRRGIACHLAGQHAAGQKQFEDYQAVDGSDVENVAWWWLCAVPGMGREAASKAMPPVGFDRRVPLPTIDLLYRGTATPADVEAAIVAGNPGPAELRSRRFYGHLYLGLWHEARGEIGAAKKDLERAAVRHWLPGYMGEVARTCLQRLDARDRKPAGAPFKPQDWPKEFAAFAQEDAAKPFPPGGVVFVGSSTIRLWKLAGDFPGLPVLNRGFGGSSGPDVPPKLELLALKHRPRAVVYYEGDNDLARGETPEQFGAAARQFLTETLAKTSAKVVLLGIKPSIRRWQLFEAQRRANAMLKEMCADPRTAFVDPTDDVLGPDGRPAPECFEDDGLHLSPLAYRRLAARLRPLLAP